MLAKKKCVRHVEREAVARCASCNDDFCRECIVEHEGRILCAPCLSRLVQAEAGSRPAWAAGLARALTTALSILLLWGAFYAFGQLVKRVPARLHDGSVWNREAP